MNGVIDFLNNRTVGRLLRQDEETEARQVFGDSLCYDAVFIKQTSGGTMVWAYRDKSIGWYNVIWWSGEVYDKGAMQNNYLKRTLIHELTHVWQSRHGSYPRKYMLASAIAQTGGVFTDVWENGGKILGRRIFEKGLINAWHSFRSRAYAFSMNDIGRNFSEFNVEQQASIVESWYAENDAPNSLGEIIPGGKMSKDDARYNYIKNNILAGNASNAYEDFADFPEASGELKAVLK